MSFGSSGALAGSPRFFSAMEHLSEAERDLLGRYWWSRAEGEMGAWVAFRYLVEDLEALGSPSQIVAVARRSVEEERRHSLWGRDWAIRFGHEDLGIPEPRSTKRLTFHGASERENRILRVAFYAFTETCGCTVLTDIRPRITQPELRKLNRQHLADEVQHARLCWAQLAILDGRDREINREWAPELLDYLPKVF
jgi:hypothetical protein